MKNNKYLCAVWALGALAACIPILDLRSQTPFANRSTTPIQMVASPGTTAEAWLSSNNGIMDSVGVRTDNELDITLVVPTSKAGYPVVVIPFDGGDLLLDDPLTVSSDGTASFGFLGASAPGVYRVLVFVGPEQYMLPIYVSRSNSVTDCGN